MGSPQRRRPGRPPLSQAPEYETRALIMRAASQLFWGRGYTPVSVGEIAAAAGITKATLYYHFSSKDAIYAAVMGHTLEQIAAAIREIARTAPTLRERLRLLAQGFLASVPTDSNHDAMLRDVDQHLSPAAQAQLSVAHESMMSAYADLMRSGIDRGELRGYDPLWLAYTFQHLLDSIVLKRNETFYPDRVAAAEAMIDLFLDGTGVRPTVSDGER